MFLISHMNYTVVKVLINWMINSTRYWPRQSCEPILDGGKATTQINSGLSFCVRTSVFSRSYQGLFISSGQERWDSGIIFLIINNIKKIIFV